MRRFWRAAAAALLGTTALAGALLSSAGPAVAGPTWKTPPNPASVLAGTWVNTNPQTKSLADLVLQTSRKGLEADGFGACLPKPCEWGLIPATAYGPTVTAKTGTSFEAKWNFGFSRTVLLVNYTKWRGHPALVVDEYTIFTDGSHRSNYAVTETLVKGRPIRPTRYGHPAADYPLGDSVRPYPGLLALWINHSPHANIRALVLSVNASHMLQVHAFGDCVPVSCNWGTVNGLTFGSSIYSKTGTRFLAPYKFSFAKKLLEGWVNARGTLLAVRTWTELTDFSGRSNYETTDYFVPVR
ncbi:MAG TPA: hypothetical protein VHZ03_09055 [Trebonia sp.]|jgi:hypothetical protein|nr:hypothetical protein [Trebonia sp.]